MEKGREGPSQYFVWAVFFAVFLTHLFLAKKWFGEHFIYYSMNSNYFLEDVSQAYQKVVSLRYHWFDFSIFKDLPETWVGKYWPPQPAMIGLWTLLVLPFQWFFLQNFFYLAAIMLGIFFSTKRLRGDDFYSMLAAVIFSCYWLVDIQLVSYEVQLAAMACIVWGFYGYLRSEYFTKFWPVVFMSVFTVLALYCDRLSPGMFLFSLFLVPENFRSKRSLTFMALALIFIVAVALPFYGEWVEALHGDMSNFFSLSGDRIPPLEVYRTVLHNPQFLLGHLSYYFIALPDRLLGYGFTGLLVVGLFFLHRLKKPYPKVLCTALGVPLIAFIAVIKKQYFYIFPLCIYFAMISALGISFVRQRTIRYVLLGLIIGLTAMQYYFFLTSRNPETTFLFSNRYRVMKDQGIPRLYLDRDIGTRKNLLKEVFWVMGQAKELFPRSFASGENNPKLIVDLEEYHLQRFTLFFLRLVFPKLEVIKDPPFQLLSCGKPGVDSLYLLSDKGKYEGSNPPRSVAGCSLQSIKPEHRLSNSLITLYRMER